MCSVDITDTIVARQKSEALFCNFLLSIMMVDQTDEVGEGLMNSRPTCEILLLLEFAL
jgi:hypothetical protein